MPLVKMKRVWDYCTYSKPFFLLVLILLCILNYAPTFKGISLCWKYLAVLIIPVIISGYGMTITRDRINHGDRLPKIIIKDVLVLGVKSSVVFMIYLGIQGYVLDLVCSPFNFPAFNLEEMLLDLPNTLHLLFTHQPAETFVFVLAGSVMFYVTSFFMEIAIARLADTGSISTAFNLMEINQDINALGWRHYAKDYTIIILAIVIFTSLTYVKIPIGILDYIWNTTFNLLAFATQFMGMGAEYSEIKEKKDNPSPSTA